MLNEKNERELAYLVKVDRITEMNADRLECAHVGGWHCVVGKGEFKAGDLAVYFEIDSKLPEVAPFTEMEFLKSKDYKIKTQKIRGEYSQGLLVPLSALNLNFDESALNTQERFLTKQLGVTYAVTEDNARKAPSVDKYKKMAQRHPDLARTRVWKYLYKRGWGKIFLFLLFGKKRDKKGGWPAWVKKTDEDRCQNMPWLFPGDNTKWIVTEKIDGSSSTFTMKKTFFKTKFYVCSRNVCFDSSNKKCFYETNIYTEMAEKYKMREVLADLFARAARDGIHLSFITIQGEVYGAGVQKRDYTCSDHRLAVFNVIFGYKDGKVVRFNPYDGADLMKDYGVPFVPILGTMELPETCEELLERADGVSQIDGLPREGFVLRTEDGQRSFKAVSNKFLLKYHG